MQSVTVIFITLQNRSAPSQNANWGNTSIGHADKALMLLMPVVSVLIQITMQIWRVVCVGHWYVCAKAASNTQSDKALTSFWMQLSICWTPCNESYRSCCWPIYCPQAIIMFRVFRHGFTNSTLHHVHVAHTSWHVLLCAQKAAEYMPYVCMSVCTCREEKYSLLHLKQSVPSLMTYVDKAFDCVPQILQLCISVDATTTPTHSVTRAVCSSKVAASIAVIWL